MKFAQEFRKALQREGIPHAYISDPLLLLLLNLAPLLIRCIFVGFPQKWVDSAVPYGQLKKCLKKVTNELHELGLDKDTLTQLAASQKDPSTVAFYYHLDGAAANSKLFRPRLTFFVHIQDGVAVDAKLTPSTRDFLEKIASSTGKAQNITADESAQISAQIGPANFTEASGPFSPRHISPSEDEAVSIQRVEVPLVFDSEFFDILQTDVFNLDALQGEEQDKMGKEIMLLGQDINKATKPSKGRKARGDMETWRNIFELYLDARVFFSTRENDHGARTSPQAVKQLNWFQDQVLSRKLAYGLKLESSRKAYTRFLSVNALLLQILKFQEINSLAVTKILKSMLLGYTTIYFLVISLANHPNRIR